MERQRLWRMILAAAFIFLATPWAAWAEIDQMKAQKILTDDGAAGDYFGMSVSVSGNLAVIGAYLDDDKGENSGAAYVFFRSSDGKWSQQVKLTASDGVAHDEFGVYLATPP